MNHNPASASASALAGLLLAAGATTAMADDSQGPTISGNVTIATDYRFRGISQLDQSPAIQGGFDYAASNGIYVGTWASNVNFSPKGVIEMDYYGGWSGDLTDHTSADVGVLWYNYPKNSGDPDLDYVEVYGKYGFYGATVGVNYSPDYFAGTNKFFYVFGEYSLPLVENFSLDMHLGWNKFEDDKSFASFIGPAPGKSPGDHYIDYSIGVSTSALGVDLAVSYVGTDLSKGECFGGSDLCEGRLVASVSKSL